MIWTDEFSDETKRGYLRETDCRMGARISRRKRLTALFVVKKCCFIGPVNLACKSGHFLQHRILLKDS